MESCQTTEQARYSDRSHALLPGLIVSPHRPPERFAAAPPCRPRSAVPGRGRRRSARGTRRGPRGDGPRRRPPRTRAARTSRRGGGVRPRRAMRTGPRRRVERTRELRRSGRGAGRSHCGFVAPSLHSAQAGVARPRAGHPAHGVMTSSPDLDAIERSTVILNVFISLYHASTYSLIQYYYLYLSTHGVKTSTGGVLSFVRGHSRGSS